MPPARLLPYRTGMAGVFRQQLTLEELDRLQPMRLIEQSRQEVTLIGEQGCCTLALLSSMPQMVVGGLGAGEQRRRL